MISEIGQFGEYLKKCNRLDEAGFREWLFYPGMLFRSPDKWWGDKGKRLVPHEGLDICLYGTTEDRKRGFDGTVRIPAVYEGEIVGIISDFLGKSLFVKHDVRDKAGRYFYSLYGHTLPSDSVCKGRIVRKGELIGTVSVLKKTKILPHLHLSTAWIPENFPGEKLDWESIGSSADIILGDPLETLGGTYRILSHSCR